MSSLARRMFELVEPIGLLPYTSEEHNEELFGLGFTDYWDTYFAARAAPLGHVPAEVVNAVFYSFGPGEVARHIPRVWRTTTPEAAIAARRRGCARALRRRLDVDAPPIARTTELLTRAALGTPVHGRAMYAALRSLEIPDDPAERLFHAADLLREHRGDGHVAALLGEGIGGTEAHVLLALEAGMRPEAFGRLHHLPAAYLDGVVRGLRDRGLIGDDGWFTDAGRETKRRIESRTDALAAAPYGVLSTEELAELMGGLEPVAARLSAD